MLHWGQLAGPAALAVSGIGLTIGLAAKTAYQRRPKETPDVHGDARFMNDAEIKNSGLLVETQPRHAHGVYVGQWQDTHGRIHYLRDVSNGHTLICGPTRTGKSISCLLPTLLAYGGAVICADEKGELWAQTAAWRQKHLGPVIKWEPGAVAGSASWNPLSEIRWSTPHEVGDAQNVALSLIDVRGHGLDRLDHWQKATFQILAGCILHEYYVARSQGRLASLSDIASHFADPGATPDDLFEAMRDNLHLAGAPHPAIAAAGLAQLTRSDREKSAVTSTLITHLLLFSDDIVCANTSTSDFSLSDIASGARPMTVFVVAGANDAVRLRPLVRLFLVTAIRTLMSRKLNYVKGQPVSPWVHPTLMILGEFPALGKLEEVENALARAASWGIKFLIEIQDITQLNGIYGLGHSVLSSMHTRAFFPTNDLATAEALSKSTGTMTAQTPHTTIMGRRFGFMGQVTKSIQSTSRPLMTPGEILTMRAATKDAAGRITAPGDMLIFLIGHRPLQAQQMLYFLNPTFAERAAI
jgi:type IV secretion system protein VirD4